MRISAQIVGDIILSFLGIAGHSGVDTYLCGGGPGVLIHINHSHRAVSQDLFPITIRPLTFATSCCGIEFMAVGAARYDFARFGFEVARASPRQADMIMVAGTITHKMAPVLKRLYDQMADPKYVIAVGGCAISGGPFKKSYHVLNGVDKILPVDVYIPGCPPRPEALLYGMMQLQRKVKLEKFFGGVNRKEEEPQKE